MFNVHIRMNATNEVRIMAWPETDWDDGQLFMWTDGNFGCDCNRSIFFARVAGEPEPDLQCGDTAFTIWVTDQGGEIIYDERDARLVQPRPE